MKSLNLTIDTYQFEVPVFQHEGRSWVALKPLCDALGIQSARQRERVEANPEISWTHMYSTGSDGKQYQMLCIQIDHVGLWLYGINPNKVKPEIREKMYVFRQKLISVLYAAVTGHLDTSMVQSLVQEIKSLHSIVSKLVDRVEVLETENLMLRTASQYRGSEAAYGMLARKAEKKTFKGPTPA
jgi:hypothetical protein